MKIDKSDFMASAEWMKENLGPALCLAKWKQVSLHLPTGLNNSCYHPPLHAIDAKSLKMNPGALHNTEHKKKQRVMNLKNSHRHTANPAPETVQCSIFFFPTLHIAKDICFVMLKR